MPPHAMTDAPPPHSARLFDAAPLMFEAAERYLRANSNFESSVVIQETVDALAEVATGDQLFALPLQHKLLSMDAALRWALFLAVAATHPNSDRFFADGPFDAQAALQLIGGVYDLGVKEAALDYLDDDSDDSESDEEEPELEAGAAPEPMPAEPATPAT
jgi:hypothetical protein